jgi:hypothetical protein
VAVRQGSGSRYGGRRVVGKGHDLDELIPPPHRRDVGATLPIRRVVEAADVAALAVHIMTNTALTGATYDIDGGQQLVEG